MNDEITREITLLIADDDDIVRKGLASLLSEQEGLDVIATALDGTEAIALGRAHQPDVFLLDIDMPVLGGIEAARIIKAEHPGKTIIMLTAFEHESTLAESLSIGINGFLTKDIPAPELAQMIKEAHSGRVVMGPKPVDILTASYLASQHSQEEFSEFIAAVQGLPERLLPVYELLLESTTNRIISRKLKLSENTVRNYVSEILAITKCRSRGELALTAMKAGLLT